MVARKSFMIASLIAAFAAPALAQDEDATFRHRVFRDDRSAAGVAEVPDFLKAGYVRLEIEAPNASDAGYCSAATNGGWAGEFRHMVDLLTGRSWTSGTAVRVWQGPAASQPTAENATMDINVLKVTRTNRTDCQADDDRGPFSSTLVRNDSSGFAVQTRRWYVARNDQDRMAYVDNALAWAAKMVGVPAAVGDKLTREGSRLIALGSNENLGSTSRLRFDPQNTDIDNGGSSIVRVYIGYQTPAGGLSMNSTNQPHIDMRLRPVASLWAQSETSYTGLDLNEKASGDLMREPIGSTNLGTIIDGSPTMKDLLGRINRATVIERFDEECRLLRLRLIQDAGFSDTDASVSVYAIALKHPFLGSGAPSTTTGYLSSSCLDERKEELENAGISFNIEIPREPIRSTELSAMIAGIPAIARAAAPREVALITSGLFRENVRVADLTPNRILGLPNQESHHGNDVVAAMVRVFDGAGCLTPTDTTSVPFMEWPAFMGQSIGGKYGLALLSLAESDEAIAAMFMFDPAPPNQHKLDAMIVTSVTAEAANAIRLAYPNGCGSWRPSNVYPQTIETERSPTEVPYRPT